MRSYGLRLILGALVAQLSWQSSWAAQVTPPSALLRMPNRLDYWKNSGFSEMVAPLRLPTDSSKTDVIQVWLKLPENAKVTAYRINDSRENRYTLAFPPGTIADRVEFETPLYGVGDVRGARIDERGRSIFHVYEKAPGTSYEWLEGYEWLRKNDLTDVTAGEVLIALFYPNGSDFAKNRFRQNNHCGACHQVNSPAPVTTSWPFRYESDTHGFFQPIAILQDEMTVRNHRSWDLNADDPFITVFCGSQPTKATVSQGARWYPCPGGQAAVGKLNLPAALKSRDPHAFQVCASRDYLFRHMDEKAKAAFASAFEECNIHER